MRYYNYGESTEAIKDGYKLLAVGEIGQTGGDIFSRR